MVEQSDLEAWLVDCGALRTGHFELSSGRHSNGYVQCALLLESPERAASVGQSLAALLSPYEPQSVLAPALGGLIIGYEVARALQVPFRFSERKGGEMMLRRGFRMEQDERVVIVEDVVTTGRSTLETVALAKAAGARVTALASIIDRSGGSTGFDRPYESLLAVDLGTWDPDECPLCAGGVETDAPGSRRA